MAEVSYLLLETPALLMDELPRMHLPRTSVDKGIKKGRISERSGPRGIPAALGGRLHEAFATSAGHQVWEEGMILRKIVR